MNMVKFTLTAALVAAITFTFNACSSGGDDPNDNGGGSGNAPSGAVTNGTGSFSGADAGDKAQAYTYEWNDDDVRVWNRYAGNRDIKIQVGCDEERENCDYISAGKIEAGIVKLQLPNSIDAKYLTETIGDMFELPSSCNAPANVKVSAVEFDVPQIEDGSLHIGYVSYNQGEGYEDVMYLYSSGTANIKCDYKIDNDNVTLNINLAQGWNEVVLIVEDSDSAEQSGMGGVVCPPYPANEWYGSGHCLESKRILE